MTVRRHMEVEEIVLPADPSPLIATLCWPGHLCDHPGIVLTFSGARHQTLYDYPYNLCSDIFLGAGHLAVSFDLPNHGDAIDANGEGLPGMATAMSQGIDVFAQIRQATQSLVEMLLSRGLVFPGRIVTSGTSRGGLAALHALAADSRITAAAIYSPVTQLEVLGLFAHLRQSPLLRESNAPALINRLDGKSIFVGIGQDDDVVSTQVCEAFTRRLSEMVGSERVHTVRDRAVGHDLTDATRQRGVAFLLDHLAQQEIT